MKYRKKPIIIDAIKFDGTVQSRDKICMEFDVNVYSQEANGFCLYITIETLEGTMRAQPGDYIIRGIKGEVYPCKPDIFEATYELMDQ